jgi:hypothetical protein
MLGFIVPKSRQIQPDLFRVPRLGVGAVMAWGKIVEIGSRRKSDGRVPGGTLGSVLAWEFLRPALCSGMSSPSAVYCHKPTTDTFISFKGVSFPRQQLL